MSCLSYVESFFKEQSQENKNAILDEALKCFKAQEDKQNNELLAFIDDFINSQEYADYIKEKKRIRTRTMEVQCNNEDIIVELRQKEQLENTEKYPLTQEQKKIYAFKEQFEKYVKNKEIELLVKKQERSINSIRARIQEARIIFEHETRKQKNERYDEMLLQKYCNNHNIGLRFLSEQAHDKLLERFRKYHSILTERKKKRQKNIYKILEKLVFERREKKKGKKSFKIKREEKIIEDMEIVGTKIKLIGKEDVEIKPINEEVASVQIEEDDKVKVEKEQNKKKGVINEKMDISEKVDKKRKKDSNKNKAIKGTKKGKEKPDIRLQLPIFPIVNPRKKLLPENIDEMVNLVEEFREFDSKMEDRDMLKSRHGCIIGDAGLKATPDVIVFQSYDQDKSYNKTIKILNSSTKIIKFRFLRFIFPDEYEQVVFDVEDFGIQKIYTGCSIKFFVNFQPYDAFKAYKGRIAFLSYNIHDCQYQQFELPVQCVPKYSDLNICPETVNFGAVPIWKAKNYDQVKIIKVQNKGSKSCTINIKKIFNHLELDSILDEENKENTAPRNSSTSEQIIFNILDDCIRNVENNFQFEPSFFSLDKMEEKRIKIFFKNASYIGDYLEKFTMDVFEDFGKNCLEIAGCKTISLHIETTGHFLTTVPEVLDFGSCVIYSCYQVSFQICNNSNHSQAISVKVPSCVSEFVQSNISMVYLGPKSSRTVFLKIHPRYPLSETDCSYFDTNTCILEFYLHLCVVSKIALDYPVVKLPTYAIITNFEDLTLSCNVTSRLSNFLNTLLIDMGDCSIYETIWMEVCLTNNTGIVQFCGFVDLPPIVTLKPNLGFCKLYPGQRKKIKLYVTPDIKDFPSFHIGSLRNSNYFFKIRVETIASLGQLKNQINPGKLKSSLHLMLQQITENDTELFTSIMGYVSELKEQLTHPVSTTDSLKNRDTIIVSRVCSLFLEKKCSITPPSNQTIELNPEHQSFDDSILNYENFLIVETNSRREVWCKVNLKRPLLEFSHQNIEFADTPCGCYSVMEIKLNAHAREIDKPYQLKKKSRLEYRAHFEIVGNSKEILVEPCYGVLESGQVRIDSEIHV